MHAPVDGTHAPGFGPVRDAFARNFTHRGEHGAAVAVHLDGQLVVDLWGGWADAQRRRPWQPDTIVHTYSVCKPMAAACAMVLVDRGQLDLDAAVETWWPEYAQAGKAGTRLRWLLSHQAGLLALRQPQPTEVIYDWDRTVALLAAEPPWWPPGRQHGEHAYFYGHLVGEVVRRVTGRTLGAFFRDEIARPLDLDFHFGLDPDEQARTADLVGLDDRWRHDLLTDRPLRYAQALTNPPGLLDPEVVNGSAWRQAEIPAVNGHGTARSIARFYGALVAGGQLDGVHALSPATVREMLTVQAAGPDLFIGDDVSWGLGMQLDGDEFGMGGLGGSMGFADARAGFGFGYATATIAGADRADIVTDALWQCLRDRDR